MGRVEKVYVLFLSLDLIWGIPRAASKCESPQTKLNIATWCIEIGIAISNGDLTRGSDHKEHNSDL